MSKNKIPSYTRKAIARYNEKITSKRLPLRKDKDKALIEALENDTEPFATLMRKLLLQHYNLPDPDNHE